MEDLEIITPYGLDKKKALKPYKKEDKSALLTELNLLQKINEELKDNPKLFDEIQQIFNKIKNIKYSLQRCENLKTLDDTELFEIKNFALASNELVERLKECSFMRFKESISPLMDVISLLDPENNGLPTFHIYEAYSRDLSEIRRKKLELEDRIMKEPESEKREELKEKRFELVSKEREEEFTIRKRLTKTLQQYTDLLWKNINEIGKLDFLIAKAKLALKYDAIKPNITNELKIHLRNFYNPYIKEMLKKRAKTFIPITLTVQKGVSVITGANMAGKTVTLKSFILNTLLAHLGFFVFAEEAQFPILDYIHFISDDMQSVSRGLSTFGAEIVSLNDLIQQRRDQECLVVMDEFARGTNPKEASYLIKAVLNYLNNLNFITIIATHYDGIIETDMTHYQVRGLKDVNFEKLKQKININHQSSIETIQDHMDYQLEQVPSENEVPKDALNIAILLGLDQEIINLAKKYYKKGEKNN
ncbi:MAG: MutS domain V [Promethearchaeota archaeon]|nr:MAG: MutS domain V [Candidatus Lokiarchaeota archaeon]